jgi:DNA repair protein RecO (recombination protein O)
VSLDRVTALIIRFTDYSETSRIVTLYSRELGKVRGLAKGGRRLKSNFESALDLLSVCSMVLLRKPSRGLDLVTEARVVERFTGLTRHLEALYGGYYLAELLGEFTQEDDPHPLLFDAAVATLRELSLGERSAEAVLHFETLLLRELGFAPILRACALCHRPLPAEGLRLDPQAGGILCTECLPRGRYAKPISSAAWHALHRLQEGTQAVMLEPAIRSELRSLMNHSISHVLGRRLKTMQYLEG